MSGQQRLDTQTLTAGALLAVLALVLGLAAYYLPVVGGVMALVVPLPLTVAHMRYGFRTGLLSSLVASSLAGIVGGPLAAVFVAANCALGLALGHGMSRRWGAWRTVALATVVFFATSAVTLAVASQTLGAAVALAGVEAMAFAYDQMAAAVRGIPTMAEAADSFVRMAALFRAYPVHTLLVAFATGGAVWSVIWYGVSAPILRRVGLTVPPAPRVAPVAAWHLPGYLGLICLVSLAGISYLGSRLPPDSEWHALALMAWSLVVLGFALQGLGLWAHFVTLAGPPPALRRAAVFVAGVSLVAVPFAGQVLMLAGMFDLALDVRGLYGTRRNRPAPGRGEPAGARGGGSGDSGGRGGSGDSGGRGGGGTGSDGGDNFVRRPPGEEEKESAPGGESVDTVRPSGRGPESEFRRRTKR